MVRNALSNFTVAPVALACALIFGNTIGSPANAKPTIPPGTVVSDENVDEYPGVLDETLIELIQKGLYAVEVVETQPLPSHPEYLAGTEQHAANVSLGSGAGDLTGYVTGRPFPDAPSGDDPRAGDKIAWNMRHAFTGDSGIISPFYWQYRNMRSGKLERELAFAAKGLKFKHRIMMEPVPELRNNPSEIFNGLYLQVLAPPDLRNTQLLIHRLEDDTKQEQGWLYIGTQRRVRRLPTGQNTDAFLGSDIMIEDFFGYNGRIMDTGWRTDYYF